MGEMRMGVGFKIVLWMGVFLLLVTFLLPQVAVAVETQPCRFYGAVKVNGSWVANGTLITACIDSATLNWTTNAFINATGQSVYFVDVPADDAGTAPKDGGQGGDIVRFKVRYEGNDYVAAQTGVWAVGDYKEVNLEVSLVTAILSGQPTGLVNYRTANITVGGTGVVVYKYKLDTGNWTGGDGIAIGANITLSGLGDGSHTVYVIGKDSLGNWQAEAGATTASWTVDATPPAATLSGQPSGAVNYNTANITVGGTDVLAYKYKLDTGSWIGGTNGIAVATNITLSGLGEGSHTVYVIGKDTAGNWQAEGYATTASWTVDTTPPTATLSGQPAGWVNYRTANITVGGTDVLAYKYKVDTGNWTTETLVSTKITLSALSDGSHTVYVIGKDTAGNWQAQGSATMAGWSIETTLPTITVTRNGTIFNGTANDTSSFIALVQYQLDGGGWINATALDGAFDEPSEEYNFTLAALGNGSHTVEVKATDAAGNFASQSLNFSSRQLFFDGNQGWNLVTYPGPSNTLPEALSSIMDELTVVWFYDNQGKWHGYNPNVPAWANDLSGLVNGQPYWIRVTGQCYWTYGG